MAARPRILCERASTAMRVGRSLRAVNEPTAANCRPAGRLLAVMHGRAHSHKMQFPFASLTHHRFLLLFGFRTVPPSSRSIHMSEK